MAVVERATAAVKYLIGTALLLLFNLLGNTTAQHWQLPLPGALIGLLLLLTALLTVARGWQRRIAPVAEPLIAHLSLLFIAPTIGAFYLTPALQSQLPMVVAVLFISTGAAMAVLIALLRWIVRGVARRRSAS